MFLVKYLVTAPSTYTVVSLVPRPTEVEYPEKRLLKLRPNRDGGVVIQRPLRDARPRKWVWKNYRPHVPNYEAQWAVLASLDTQTRWLAGFTTPTVLIWENETKEGGFDGLTSGSTPDLSAYTNLDWTEVKFTQVTRTTRKGGGPVTYDDSIVEFVIVDTSYSAF